MPHSALPHPHDPLGGYRFPAVISGTPTPVPLIGTSFSVAIDAGLAVVKTMRRFRNAEPESIEVTMTFPVPLHASLFDLVARIGERRLQAQSRSRTEARDIYEGAIDEGRAAVLHEEVLRGVHQLSVAHVPSGAEITVEATWSMPLAAVPGGGVLHIPVTVGDIYGRSPLPDSDDLVQGSAVHEADLSVDCSDGIVALAGGKLSQGHARLRLDAPIRLTVTRWQSRTLRGIAADGRGVAIEVTPAAVGSLPLDVAILVDRSGSMGDAASGLLHLARAAGPARTKHEVVIAGLLEGAAATGPQDRIDLWEFGSAASPVPGNGLASALGSLSPPDGGTEIGEAIRTVLSGRTTRDVFLITDGKSHALDVHGAAMSGRRFHVVLIGEDSLEAHVGHLATLTGGQVFIAAGLEAGGMIRQAIDAMRLPHAVWTPITGALTDVEAMVAGMQVKAAWYERPDADAGPWSRATAAVAASLALPRLTKDAAAVLAEAEGLVTHLTSLVLVDEAGEAQARLPAQRRIQMMKPRTSAPIASVDLSAAALDLSVEISASPMEGLERPAVLRGQSEVHFSAARVFRTAGPSPLAACQGRVDWAAQPEALRRGDLSQLPEQVAEAVRAAAANSEVVSLAAELDVPTSVLVLALLADSESPNDRSAARFARAVLGKAAKTSLSGRAFNSSLRAAVCAAAQSLGL